MRYAGGKEVKAMKYLKIFTDFLDVVEPLNDDERGRLFIAMLGYALDGREPELPGNERFVWAVAKQHIDREVHSYKTKVASMETARSCLQKQRSDKETLIPEEDNDNDKYKNKYKDNERVCPSAAPAASRALAVPTLEEVEAYCQERGNRVNARRFMDFYTANGWRMGKTPMKDWKAAVRSWETNGMDDPRPAPARATGYMDEYKAAMEMIRAEEAKQCGGVDGIGAVMYNQTQ